MTKTTQRPAPAQHTLVTAGGWPFLIAAALGRLPSSMVQLGYLMVLSQDGRGLAIGGLAVAAVGLGTAAGAPLVAHPAVQVISFTGRTCRRGCGRPTWSAGRWATREPSTRQAS